MYFWFVAPTPNCFLFPVPTFLPSSESEPTIQPLPKEMQDPYMENFKVKLNISRQDLQKAGYNHKRCSWSEEEDKKLLQLAKSQNLNWNQIGKKMERRNSKMCYSRYRRLCYQTKKRWTLKQEQAIMEQIGKLGLEWKQIAKFVPGRTPRQIEQHYQFCLRSDIDKSEWKIEQDILLVRLLQQYGTNWKKLQQEIKGRSENQIKNRYFGRLLKIAAEKEKILSAAHRDMEI